MATPVDIGSSFDGSSASSITLTTTAAVPSGAKILLAISWFSSLITSISDGTYTYTVDKDSGTSVNNRSAVASVDATSGLASGSTITVSLNGGATSRGICAVYVTGLTTGGAYGAVSQIETGNTDWSSTTTTVTAGDLLWGMSHWEDSTPATNTASGGNTELHDINGGGGAALCTVYQTGTGAAIAASGTWSGTSANTTSIAVAYTATAVFTGFTNTAVPTVTGTLNVGSTLTANPGTWSPTPGSYVYSWHRADDASATNDIDIGATGATYTLAAADSGKYIRAGVYPQQ